MLKGPPHHFHLVLGWATMILSTCILGDVAEGSIPRASEIPFAIGLHKNWPD